MEFTDNNGAKLPLIAPQQRTQSTTRTNQNERLTSKVPQNYAPDLPLLAWIAEQQKVTNGGMQ